MEIKVLGAGCENCGNLYDNTVQAVEELGLDATVEKVEDLVEIVKLGVMSAPALMVDGKLLVGGRVPKTKELKKILEKATENR